MLIAKNFDNFVSIELDCADCSVEDTKHICFPMVGDKGILLYGSAPYWLYHHVINYYNLAPWVAIFDASKNYAVVIKSSKSMLPVGSIISC